MCFTEPGNLRTLKPGSSIAAILAGLVCFFEKMITSGTMWGCFVEKVTIGIGMSSVAKQNC